MPDKRILKATGHSVLRIGFDPAKFARLLPDQQQEFVCWHVARVTERSREGCHRMGARRFEGGPSSLAASMIVLAT
jgi:hypothetical protein